MELAPVLMNPGGRKEERGWAIGWFMTGIWKNWTVWADCGKEGGAGMAAKGTAMGRTAFRGPGSPSNFTSSATPSSSSPPMRVLLAKGVVSSRRGSLLRATSGASASTELDRTPRGKYLNGEAAKLVGGREGEAGREAEECMEGAEKRGGREGGV